MGEWDAETPAEGGGMITYYTRVRKKKRLRCLYSKGGEELSRSSGPREKKH